MAPGGPENEASIKWLHQNNHSFFPRCFLTQLFLLVKQHFSESLHHAEVSSSEHCDNFEWIYNFKAESTLNEAMLHTNLVDKLLEGTQRTPSDVKIQKNTVALMQGQICLL